MRVRGGKGSSCSFSEEKIGANTPTNCGIWWSALAVVVQIRFWKVRRSTAVSQLSGPNVWKFKPPYRLSVLIWQVVLGVFEWSTAASTNCAALKKALGFFALMEAEVSDESADGNWEVAEWMRASGWGFTEAEMSAERPGPKAEESESSESPRAEEWLSEIEVWTTKSRGRNKKSRQRCGTLRSPDLLCKPSGLRCFFLR